jgi:tetratricopeptide (TPR) repeat protein
MAQAHGSGLSTSNEGGRFADVAAIDEAAFYRSLLVQDPRAASIWVSLAGVLLNGGRREEALEAVDVGLAIDASLAQGWLTRGALCKALLRFEDAVDAFKQASQLLPGKAPVLIALGTVYAELGRLLDAEECLRRAVALNPNSVEAHSNLGSVYVRQRRFDLAEAACRRALALAPGLVVAHQNLAGALAGTRPEEASLHRDAAYRRQQIFIEAAAQAQCTVLVLCAADAGNVPLRGLLPRESCTLINWFIEYAPPGQAAALPHYDFVFNAIGETDFAVASTAPVEQFVSQCRRPLLNQPACVARTGRGDVPTLLAGIAGIVVPRVLRLSPGEDVPNATRRAGLRLPVILRPFGSHGGEGAQQITSWAELEDASAHHDGAYVTEFVDSRGADELYRKYRAIFIDRVPYPYHLAVSPHWLVHYWTAGMGGDAARRIEEERFLEAPAASIGASAMRALAEIGARLDLDYAGIDFAILPDGALLVFEANATMLVHSENSKMFAYKNPAVQRIRDAFDAMVGARLDS